MKMQKVYATIVAPVHLIRLNTAKCRANGESSAHQVPERILCRQKWQAFAREQIKKVDIVLYSGPSRVFDSKGKRNTA